MSCYHLLSFFLYSDTEIANSSSSKQLFGVCKQLSGHGKTSLPTIYLPCQLPDVFCDYFIYKVTLIRFIHLNKQPPPLPFACCDLCLSSVLVSFCLMSQQELEWF